jgi:hypothetical protein
MRWKLFTLMLLAGPLAFAGPIYKWVDENGVTHYSDQPHENAQKLQLGPVQTYKATSYAVPAAAATAAPSASYRCAVNSPGDQQDFPDASSVAVSVHVDPQNQDNQIFVMLDGRLVPGLPTQGPQFTLNNVDRGEHNVAVVVRDPAGKAVCQSAPVTFFVRQPSLLAPANPNNPANENPAPPPVGIRPH